MANLDGDFLERGGNNGQRGDEFGVAIALDDLRSDRGRLEIEAPADGLFHLHSEMRGITYGAKILPTDICHPRRGEKRS